MIKEDGMQAACVVSMRGSPGSRIQILITFRAQSCMFHECSRNIYLSLLPLPGTIRLLAAIVEQRKATSSIDYG